MAKVFLVDPVLRDFVADNDEQKRISVAAKILLKHPGCVPVIVGRADTRNTPPITKNKFIVPEDKVFGSFTLEIRRNMESLDPKLALFYFVSGNIIPPSGSTMSEIYRKYKSVDGFLYITYTSENTFG